MRVLLADELEDGQDLNKQGAKTLTLKSALFQLSVQHAFVILQHAYELSVLSLQLSYFVRSVGRAEAYELTLIELGHVESAP